MQVEDAENRLDRHALVLAVWLAAGAVAAELFHMGFGTGGLIWLGTGFAAILAGYAGHVIVNAILGTGFSPREIALGLVAMMVALLALVLSSLLVEGFSERFFLPVTAGLVVLVLAVVLTMVTRHGPRRAFEVFDVIRDNNRRASSLLPHRGGRK